LILSVMNTSQNLSLPRLCAWATGYAFRRGWPLLGVSGSLLLRVTLDVLKPWPMVFLIDYVLREKAMPSLLERFVEALPGPATPSALIGWSVGFCSVGWPDWRPVTATSVLVSE